MKKKIQVTIGLLIGVLLLWYLFKDTDWREVGLILRAANVAWLILTLLVILLSFFVRVWRWGYIVNPVVPVPFWHLFSATQIGFMANFILPARAGEVIRALALTRSRNIPFGKTMAFVAVDRATDLFGLFVVFLITLMVFHPAEDVYLPEDFRNLYAGPISQGMIRGALFSMTAVLVAVVGMMLLLIIAKDFFLHLSDMIIGRVSTRLAEMARRLFEHFTEGMHVLTSYKDLAKACAVSLLLWATFGLVQVCAYMAFDLDVPWYTPFVILSLLAVFISIPGPPGFIGPFHAGIVGGLILANPDVNMNAARAMAIVGHLFNLIPIVIVGVICLSLERLDLGELKRQSEAIDNSAAPNSDAKE
ncbi:MAG TPA: flippase-like domain-containing protein [Candidatus Hydrogenedentes bacterium]|nr:flippase-like domain-containing protein [Candidatus Hydrogenedentota bacterium]